MVDRLAKRPPGSFFAVSEETEVGAAAQPGGQFARARSVGFGLLETD
jgi:hypothetical protein